MNSIRVTFFGSSTDNYSKDIENIFDFLFEVFDEVIVISGGYQGTMKDVAEKGKSIAEKLNRKIYVQGILFDGYKNDPSQSDVNIPNDISDAQISSTSIGSRVQSMIELADIIIALPGKTGTLHEIIQTIETVQYGMDYSEFEKNFQRIFIHQSWENSIKNLYDNGNMSEKVYKKITETYFTFNARKQEKREKKIAIFKNRLSFVKLLQTNEEMAIESEGDFTIHIQDLYSQKRLDKSHKINKIVSDINKIIVGRYFDKQNSVVGLDIALKEKSENKEELFRLDTVGSTQYIKALDKFLNEYKSIIDSRTLSSQQVKWRDIECVISKKITTLYYTNHISEENRSEFKGTKEAELYDWLTHIRKNELGKTVYWSSISLGNQYYISVFLLLDVYLPKDFKNEIEKTINQYLLEDTVIKINEKSVSELKKSKDHIEKYAKNAAIAQVLARTTSHNTGSHILSNNLTQYSENHFNDFKFYLQLKKAEVPCIGILKEFEEKQTTQVRKQHLEEFKIYLRQRMLFNADITSNSSKSYSSVKFGDVLNAFKDLEIVKTHISGLDNCSFGGFNSSIDDIVISLPNGVLGFHALYIVFENLIRNYFKHSNGSGKNFSEYGNEKYLYIDLKQLHGLSNEYYYSIDISDGSQINQDTHYRISNLISEPILNKDNELRSEGLGYLEIKAALSYINNIPLSEIDSPCLPDFKKEDGSSIQVFSIRSLKEDDFSLRYRIFLPKPFLIKTSNTEILNTDLIRKGIVDSKSATPFDSKCEFYFGDLPTIPASVSPRIAKTREGENPDDFIQSYYTDFLESIDNNVCVYALKTDNTTKEIVKEKLSQKDNGYNLIAEDSHISEYSIFLDLHNAHFNDFIESKYPPLNKLFYEGYGSNSKVGQMMSNLSRTTEKFFIQKIIEAYFTKIIVIDERIQRHAESIYTKSKINQLRILDVLKLSGVSVPAKDTDKLDLNNPKIEKELFRINLKSYLENELKDCKLKPFVLIHLGVVEKLTENKSLESISEQIQLIKPNNLSDDSIVFISERGTPKNVERKYRFMHYSNVAKNLVEEQSKISLTNAVFASRCLINQS